MRYPCGEWLATTVDLFRSVHRYSHCGIRGGIHSRLADYVAPDRHLGRTGDLREPGTVSARCRSAQAPDPLGICLGYPTSYMEIGLYGGNPVISGGDALWSMLLRSMVWVTFRGALRSPFSTSLC